MTLDEFAAAQPALAGALIAFAWHVQVDGVYLHDDRWEAHCSVPPSGEFEIAREARCLPSCVDGSGRPRRWVWESHVCCVACEADPGHRYQAVHE